MHEHIGLLLVFIGFSWLGFGLYDSMLAANLLLIPDAALRSGWGLIKIPLFFGIGAVITYLGIIELREVLPGKNR
jgi:hypothetical protein